MLCIYQVKLLAVHPLLKRRSAATRDLVGDPVSPFVDNFGVLNPMKQRVTLEYIIGAYECSLAEPWPWALRGPFKTVCISGFLLQMEW